MKMQKIRPDFTDLLAHFTTNRQPVGKTDPKNPVTEKAKGFAFSRLVSILTDKKIIASTMPWTGSHAVCFTECPWTSLLDHTKSYSPYGIGFKKGLIFSRNGSPVFYVRADQYDKQNWHPHLRAFVTPFWPAYRPKSLDSKSEFKTCDYSHEREWRVPHDFQFEYDQIEFVVVDKYEDLAKFPRDLKDAIGREKFLLMDNYRKIETLWPVHNLGM
jgi:hypothetical protein